MECECQQLCSELLPHTSPVCCDVLAVSPLNTSTLADSDSTSCVHSSNCKAVTPFDDALGTSAMTGLIKSDIDMLCRDASDTLPILKLTSAEFTLVFNELMFNNSSLTALEPYSLWCLFT